MNKRFLVLVGISILNSVNLFATDPRPSDPSMSGACLGPNPPDYCWGEVYRGDRRGAARGVSAPSREARRPSDPSMSGPCLGPNPPAYCWGEVYEGDQRRGAQGVSGISRGPAGGRPRHPDNGNGNTSEDSQDVSLVFCNEDGLNPIHGGTNCIPMDRDRGGAGDDSQHNDSGFDSE